MMHLMHHAAGAFMLAVFLCRWCLRPVVPSSLLCFDDSVSQYAIHVAMILAAITASKETVWFVGGLTVDP